MGNPVSYTANKSRRDREYHTLSRLIYNMRKVSLMYRDTRTVSRIFLPCSVFVRILRSVSAAILAGILRCISAGILAGVLRCISAVVGCLILLF